MAVAHIDDQIPRWLRRPGGEHRICVRGPFHLPAESENWLAGNSWTTLPRRPTGCSTTCQAHDDLDRVLRDPGRTARPMPRTH